MLNSNNIHHEVDQILKKSEINDYQITLGFDAKLLSGNRDLTILLNNNIIYSKDILTGSYEIKEESFIPPGKGIKLEAKTSSHVNGDKIIITKLEINGVNIHKTNLWLLDRQKFTHSDGEIETSNNGLYHNGTWSIEIPTPVFPWMMEKKRQLSKDVHYIDRDSKAYEEKLDDIYYKLLNVVYRR
jgi:hypothetical protein